MKKLEIREIVYSLQDLERKALCYAHLEELESIAKASSLSLAEVTTGLQLLQNRGLVELVHHEHKVIVLDKIGERFLGCDLPEIQVLKALGDKEVPLSKLALGKEELASALGVLKKEKLVEMQKKEELCLKASAKAKSYLLEHAENPLRLFQKAVPLDNLSSEQKEVFKSFQMRKGFLKEQVEKEFSVRLSAKGSEIAKALAGEFKDLVLLEKLSYDVLKEKSWKGKEFRHYDVSLDTPVQDIGRRHPMKEANAILKDIFVEMGFQEMEGPMVEAAFWNMDVLWIPQDHPARDEQDTFYLDGEAKLPSELVAKYKDMHETGIKKSHTPKGEWSEDIAKRRLLRTHSTATTYRMLAFLGEEAKKGKDINGKYFYVANNFRNEAIDATHLAEFYQAEGFIIGDTLSLADLMGFVKEYYAKLKIDTIRFKPTFNPYTEPSMEAHYYDAKLKKWYALINSGIFRPETLAPLGLSHKTIIAWGMGASRVATLLSGKESMREITGATCDFEWLRTRPLMKRSIVR